MKVNYVGFYIVMVLANHRDGPVWEEMRQIKNSGQISKIQWRKVNFLLSAELSLYNLPQIQN